MNLTQQFGFVETSSPTTWSVVHKEGGVDTDREVTWHVYGIVQKHDLPPFSQRPK